MSSIRAPHGEYDRNGQIHFAKVDLTEKLTGAAWERKSMWKNGHSRKPSALTLDRSHTTYTITQLRPGVKLRGMRCVSIHQALSNKKGLRSRRPCVC